MKKLLILLTLLVLAGQASAQGVGALDKKNGFRDAVFSSDITSLSGMEQIEEQGESKIYKRTSDEMKVGNATLKSISYVFYKGKLSSILIDTEGLSNSRALLESLRASYGRGGQPNQFMQDFDWWGRVVYMNYKENSITGDASVYMSSNAITKQKQADDKEAAKRAKSDL